MHSFDERLIHGFSSTPKMPSAAENRDTSRTILAKKLLSASMRLIIALALDSPLVDFLQAWKGIFDAIDWSVIKRQVIEDEVYTCKLHMTSAHISHEHGIKSEFLKWSKFSLAKSQDL